MKLIIINCVVGASAKKTIMAKLLKLDELQEVWLVFYQFWKAQEGNLVSWWVESNTNPSLPAQFSSRIYGLPTAVYQKQCKWWCTSEASPLSSMKHARRVFRIMYYTNIKISSFGKKDKTKLRDPCVRKSDGIRRRCKENIMGGKQSWKLCREEFYISQERNDVVQHRRKLILPRRAEASMDCSWDAFGLHFPEKTILE